MSVFKLHEMSPSNWKELQEYNAAILMECGFNAEVEKTIETVRGKVEVDVYAERKTAFESTIICECKYWESPVPKTVVHAFRTVVNDSGASQGYIISKAGFQKGAYEAIDKSNVSILTWEEFQEKFKKEWLLQIIERNYKTGRELMGLSHKIKSMLHSGALHFDEARLLSFYEKKESDFHFFTFKEHYLDLETYEISYSQIDSSIDDFQRKNGIKFSSYRRFFNYLYIECNEIIAEWKRILSGLKTD